jgi:hypothetical protein
VSEVTKGIEDNRSECIPILNDLLSKAFNASPFDVLCSVLRVGGMSDANWDPFEESRKAFDDFNWILEKSLAERTEDCSRRISLLMYCQAVEMTAPHEILTNLLRCVLKGNYVVSPFRHLGRKSKQKLFSWIPPSAKQKFQEIKDLASRAGETELIEKIDSFFDDKIRNAFSHSDYILTDKYFRYTEGGLAQQIALEDLDKRIDACFGFYGAFLALHKHWLHLLGKARRFHKWPRYEVLELLSTEEEGVYGFNVHFSNDSKAIYTRSSTGIEAINIYFEKEGAVNFFIGNLDDLEPVWKIDGKPVEDWDALE